MAPSSGSRLYELINVLKKKKRKRFLEWDKLKQIEG